MKIGCLQFNPRLGEVEQNIARADAILDNSMLNESKGRIDLLVLPELAFTGYNFPDLKAITPYLEPCGQGPTAEWAITTAQRLKCNITVGYPEKSIEQDGSQRNYNSTITVSPKGEIVLNYRKSFLYYTDETWASEGPHGSCFKQVQHHVPFFCGPIPSLHSSWTIGHGICMDINPYQFKADAWQVYEFARTMLHFNARLVVLSMAWLTRLLPQDLQIEPDRPDMETVAYWLERFGPFSQNVINEDVIVVFANRCGVEGNEIEPDEESRREMQDQGLEEKEQPPPPMGDQVCYAGSSCVMKFQRGSVRMFERSEGEVAIMGKGEEGLLVVDTNTAARFLLQQKTS